MADRKIVSLVVAYDPYRPELVDVVNELEKVGSVVLFTTDRFSFNRYADFGNCMVYLFSESIGKDLVYKPREWIIDNIDGDWDYVLYNEGDIFIPTESINNLIEMYEDLERPFIPSFCRYEYDERDDTKRWIDLHPFHGGQRNRRGDVVNRKWDDLELFEPVNLHSGNWVFSKEDVKSMMENNQFESYYREHGYKYGKCEQLESAASVPYMFYTKVYPYNLEKVECEHPSKYIYTEQQLSKEDVLKRIEEL